MMKAICIILGVAVAAGAAFAIYNLKWFAPKDKTEDTQQTLQADMQIIAAQLQIFGTADSNGITVQIKEIH